MGRHAVRLACALAATALLVVVAGGAAAQSGESPQAGGTATSSSSLAAYRRYAGAQAEMLARMTRVLAQDVRAGDIGAAQNDYAMAHRYLERIKPAAALLDPALDGRMDAAVEGDPSRRLDAGVSGFHRLEHDLFASRSTDGLSVYADRLHDDALRLQKVVATSALPADALVDAATETVASISTRTLADGSEPYSKTELWDIEASLDGTREIFAASRPQVEARDPLLAARISRAFAEADQRLSQFEAGCGFKSFDELSSADKASLGAATTALARELSRLRTRPTID